MNFGFTEDQDRLREELRRFLGERAPMAEVRRVMATDPGYCPDLWREMGELGWLGLTLPEAYGGAGLSWVDLVVVLEAGALCRAAGSGWILILADSTPRGPGVSVSSITIF